MTKRELSKVGWCPLCIGSIFIIILVIISSCTITKPVNNNLTWTAPRKSDRAIILHSGHWYGDGPAFYDHLIPIAELFQSNGFDVYGMVMPPTPHGPESDFFGELYKLVDELTINGYKIFMVGLSGGGWTTTMFTAIDSRIIKGYSIAGDLPIDMRVQKDLGDWEQQNPPIDYREAYKIADERIMHIFNWDDPCSFAHVNGDIGTSYINDINSNKHEITLWTANYILNDIKTLDTLSEGW